MTQVTTEGPDVISALIEAKMMKIKKKKHFIRELHFNNSHLIVRLSSCFATIRAQTHRDFIEGLILLRSMGFTGSDNLSQEDYCHIATFKRNWLKSLPFLTVQLLGYCGRALCKLKTQKQMGTQVMVVENQQEIQGQLTPGTAK